MSEHLSKVGTLHSGTFHSERYIQIELKVSQSILGLRNGTFKLQSATWLKCHIPVRLFPVQGREGMKWKAGQLWGGQESSGSLPSPGWGCWPGSPEAADGSYKSGQLLKPSSEKQALMAEVPERKTQSCLHKIWKQHRGTGFEK